MSASAGTVIKGEPQTSASLNSSNVRINLDGIFEGDLEPLRVTAQSSPDMTVAVASDNDRAYIQGNTPLDYAGGNSSTFTMPAGGGEKQIDLLTLDSAGALAIVSGTPTTGTPSPPTHPSGKIVVAEIFLRNGGTVIKNTDDSTNGYIFKARTPLFNSPENLLEGIKGWVNFDGTGTPAANDSYNVSSIGDNGAGDYTVNWDTDFTNINYAAVACQNVLGATTTVNTQTHTFAVGSVDVNVEQANGNQNDTATAISVIAIGDQ